MSRRQFQRLCAMSPQELVDRSAQAASIWIERITATPQAPDPVEFLTQKAPELADGRAALEIIRYVAPSRFFRGVELDATAQYVRDRLNGHVQDAVAVADRLMSRRFDLLGYKDLSFGEPIDWQLDPVAQRRAALVHWTRLNPLDRDLVGDSKVVWEINRHQWIVQLAHAAVLAGDDRYAESAMSAVDDWLRDNPAGFGINWTSSLEVSYRLMSWCWTLMLLRDSAALSAGRLTAMLASIWQHAEYVRKHLSYYFSPNTHLTGEALGLFYAGTLFSEFKDARRWRDLGARVLLSQLHAQTFPDGVHFEQSTCYHRYTTDTYLQFLLLSERNDLALAEGARSQIARMVEFLVSVQLPDGSLPLIGDNDGGAALPLLPPKANDARATIGIAAAVFDRPEFAAAAAEPRPEVAWLLGPEAAARIERLMAVPPRRASSMFADGGYAVTRSDDEDAAHQLIVDVGPIGCPHSSGHGHADLLSIQCAVFGDPCIVDAGTYCYTAEPQWRDFLRGSAAHSTVRVDGRDQADIATPFAWHQRPHAHLNMWFSGPSVDYVDGYHDAYRRLSDPVIHRRRVAFVKPHYWVVVDDLYGAGEHDLDVQFQFAPMPVELSGERACAHTNSGHALWISPFASSAVTGRIECGSVDPPRGWISEDYGRRTPAPMLVYSTRAQLPWRMLTLLLPARDAAVQPVFPDVLHDERGLPSGLRFDATLPSMTISPETLVVGTDVLPIRGFEAAA